MPAELERRGRSPDPRGGATGSFDTRDRDIAGRQLPEDGANKLVEALLSAGYGIGVDQRIAIANIIGDERRRTGASAARLKRRLTPLIAKDAQSQFEVAGIIGRVFANESREIARELQLRDAADTERLLSRKKRITRARWINNMVLMMILVFICWRLFPDRIAPLFVGPRADDFVQPVGIEDPGVIEIDPDVTFVESRDVIVGRQLPSPLRPYAIVAAFIAPIGLFGFWATRRLRRWRAWQYTIDQTLNAPDSAMAAEFDEGFFPNVTGMRRAARNLQKPMGSGGSALQLRRSIVATARNAGYFTPVRRGRSTAAELVVLVERKTVHDHVARMADAILDRIEAAGVRIKRYHYEDDPRLSRAFEDARPPGFSELITRFGDYRFLVIGSTDGFFHPVTGELMEWTEAFTELTSNALLNASPKAYHSFQEEQLQDLGFWMSSASPVEMTAYGDAVASGRDRLTARRFTRTTNRRHSQTAAVRPTYEPLSVFRDPFDDGSLGPEMIVIPAGSFMMGSPKDEPNRRDNEGPQREILFDRPFALGRCTTTFEEYDNFCCATGREMPDGEGWGRGRRPVINVSWHDAVAYCGWLSERTGNSYRLASETEWEYACRAGTTGEHAFELSPKRAKYAGSGPGPVSVDDLQADNAWGLRHMHGNVWEWTASVYEEQDNHASTKPADVALRVARGGSWNYVPSYLRSAIRFRYEPVNRISYLGFRPARTLNL